MKDILPIKLEGRKIDEGRNLRTYLNAHGFLSQYSIFILKFLYLLVGTCLSVSFENAQLSIQTDVEALQQKLGYVTEVAIMERA